MLFHLNYDFYMGKYEVTQAQWLAVMGSWPGSSPDRGVGDNYPAYYVSWEDAQAFITALNIYVTNSSQGPARFRLPSEAEWEDACRAGTLTRFVFGDSPSGADKADAPAGTLPGNRSDYMWFSANNSPFGSKEVGQKLPNQFGLFDMSGNLWEWCQDYWYQSYDSASRPDDGSAWETPAGDYRIARGGYWNENASYCRSATRTYSYQDYRGRSFGYGFRFARTP